MPRSSFDDVLQQLGLDAKDSFVSHLQTHGSVKNARLACRALRETVDGSLRQVSLTLRVGDKARWEEGTAWPLHRWTRCCGVSLSVNAKEDTNADYGETWTNLLLVPFTGLSLEVRQRITYISVWYPDELTNYLYNPEALLSLLLRSLPALRHVCIRGCLSVDRMAQQLLYDAVASLPHLEELSLRACCALQGIHTLRDRGLRRLSICCTRDSRLDEHTLAGIARLRQLQHLSAELHDSDPDGLRALLQLLPPSLHTLELPACAVLSPRSLEATGVLHLQDNVITHVTIAGTVCVEDLMNFFICGLLSSGTVAAQLQLLHISELLVTAAGPGELVRLRCLLRRCARVEVGVLRLKARVSPHQAAECASVLLHEGAVGELQLGLPYVRELRVRPWPVAQRAATPAASAAAAAAEADEGPGAEPEAASPAATPQAATPQAATPEAATPIPAEAASPTAAGAFFAPSYTPSPAYAPSSPPFYAQLPFYDPSPGYYPSPLYAPPAPAHAFHEWQDEEAAPREATPPPADLTTPATGERDPLPTAPNLVDQALEHMTAAAAAAAAQAAGVAPGMRSLLLLRGPLVAGLAWSEHALCAWSQKLFEEAALEQQRGDADQHAPAAPTLPGYLLLPFAAAVLVQCRGAAELAAVAAAARGVAAKATAAAGGGGGGEGGAAEVLQVLPAAVELWSAGDAEGALTVEDVFVCALSQAAQRMWDGSEHSESWSEQQRLAWLMEQWAELWVSTPGVDL